MLLGDLPALINLLLLAFGAAVSLGTGGALRHFRRTGAFPSQPPGREITPSAVRFAKVKMATGVVMALWGLAGLTLTN